jgi:diketogulonate reductase-like aldo/keto reductase
VMGYFKLFCSRFVPALVLFVAVFVGWLSQHELPEGVLFACLFPVMKGKLPPPIFGHGHMDGTPEVPVDMAPAPRPEHELFLQLPGGHAMPQNGLGMCCRPTAYDDVLVRRTVLWYLLLGGRHIDGAHLYLNHKAIGLGIKDAMARGVPREEIFVTTKVFPRHFGYNTTSKAIPTYLEELGLEYIDLVLLHFPIDFPTQFTSECKTKGLSNAQCRVETWTALSEARNKGLIRNAGVSNFAISQLEQIGNLPEGAAPIAVHQFAYNPWAPDHTIAVLMYCHANNIAVTAYTSLAGMMQHSKASTTETLNALAAKHGKSITQIMLRWGIQHKAAVIPGTGNPKHMKENLAVYEFELSMEDMESIDALRSDETAKKFFYMTPPEDK